MKNEATLLKIALNECMLLMSAAPLAECTGEDECLACYWRGSVVGLYEQIFTKSLGITEDMSPQEAMERMNTHLRNNKMYDA